MVLEEAIQYLKIKNVGDVFATNFRDILDLFKKMHLMYKEISSHSKFFTTTCHQYLHNFQQKCAQSKQTQVHCFSIYADTTYKFDVRHPRDTRRGGTFLLSITDQINALDFYSSLVDDGAK